MLTIVRRSVLVAALISTCLLQAQARQKPLPQLRVSENKRFLVTADGRPFFWLGDTAWELFHRLTREDGAWDSHLKREKV